ncbi:MAG: hypothetical protein HYV41_02720 [Candidatus Magasanikbacteria bacterium]|nr:hypothetical protein [Candidatus Magasanikbacteria bacterium]
MYKPNKIWYYVRNPMRQEIDKIEIKEPPIEELNKKRSCIKRTCITGCGCFVIIFIISLLLLRFAIGPRTKEVRDLPQYFTETIPIYDAENIERITYTSGKEKGKYAEVAAYVPKLVLSPIIIHFDTKYRYIPRTITEREMTKWEKFIAFMGEPLTDSRDIYKIEWIELSADKNFITEYYQKELERSGFELGVLSTTREITQFTFSNETQDIDGLVYITDNKETQFTDYISLTVNIPSK